MLLVNNYERRAIECVFNCDDLKLSTIRYKEYGVGSIEFSIGCRVLALLGVGCGGGCGVHICISVNLTYTIMILLYHI